MSAAPVAEVGTVRGVAPAGRFPGTERTLPGSPVTVLVASGARQDRASLAEALLRAAPDRLAVTEAGAAGGHGETVDAVVFAASAAAALGTAELDLLHAMRDRSPHVVLALTGIEQHLRWQAVLEDDLALLRSAGIVAAPFAVSVQRHAHAVALGEPALAGASGVPALVERLLEVAERSTAGTGAEPAPAEPDRSPWQQVLGDGVAAASSDVDFDLRARVRSTVAEAERAVDESDPARDWAALDAWLRERLTADGAGSAALLGDRTTEIAAALATRLGGAPLRPVALPRMPDLLEHVPPRDARTDARRPLAARGRTVVMSGYGGLMMALILPRFAGVQLPVAVVVGCALLAAAVMGAAALSGERKRQLDARRTRARSLVRHTADGVLLVAGKYTRDALRAAQQQLRDECAARSARPREPRS